MFGAEQRVTDSGELQRVLGRHIAQRTWGRVQELHVEITKDGHVAVRGRAPTYYVKQLALMAVREVVETAPVELHIEVAALPPAAGYDWQPAGTEPVSATSA